ncbi:MAG: DUF1624 domain-containing protein [Lachnospiraceae bacterium]|nr:DUF1624 domain-containing protein [Lachnospiraceae bacterium]
MKRYGLFDTIRGITLLSMILFHTCWDLCYLGLGVTEDFLYGPGAYLWQQSICWTFILLSGFCFSFGHHPVRRGLLELGGGILITAVTYFVIPDALDLFGVLWMLGSSTLVLAGAVSLKGAVSQRSAESSLSGKRVKASAGLIISFLLFFLTRNVNRGALGFEGLEFIKLPESLYRNYLTAFLGFPFRGFYSSDYFSFIPWFFLYLTGYFLHKAVFADKKESLSEKSLFMREIRPLSFPGRHSLFVYMIHQPVIYGITALIALILNKG